MAGREYTVRVTIGERSLEVTGPVDGLPELVKSLAQALEPVPLALGPGGTDDLGVNESSETQRDEKSPPDEEQHEELSAAATSQPGTRPDPKTFFEEKKPSTQIEAAVVAAFYITEVAPEPDRAEVVDATNLQDVLRQARRKLPARTQQLLVDTHKAGYLNRVSSGKYQVNNVGHNLVNHTLGPDNT